MQSAFESRPSNNTLPLMVAAILLSLAGGLFYVLFRTTEPPSRLLSSGMLADFTLTIPIAYWLIVRKRTVAFITILPVMVLGLAIGWFILPAAHADLFTYCLWIVTPTAAFIMAIIIGKKVAAGIRAFRRDSRSCKVRRIEAVVGAELAALERDETALSRTIAQEITTFYYLLRRVNKDGQSVDDLFETPAGARTFSYHHDSGMTAMLLVTIVIVMVEIVSVHLLVAMLSHVLAWLATASSVYFAFFIVAQSRAIATRPLFVHDRKIHFRNGMVNQMVVDFEDIESVVASSIDPEESEDVLDASFPASHNIIVRLKTRVKATILYGQSKQAKTILLHLDNPASFLELMADR